MLDNFIIQTLEGRRVHRSPAPNGTKVDTEFQTIGEENWRKESTGLGHDARGFCVSGAGCIGAFRYWRHVAKGSIRHKKPPPGHMLPEGALTTRAAWTPTHTARLPARRRLHCSAPHCKGYCHTDRPTRKPWDFTPTTFNIVPPLPHLSRGLTPGRTPLHACGPVPYPCISAPAFGRCIRSQRVTSAATGCSGDPS
jgi:hypothetical protein